MDKWTVYANYIHDGETLVGRIVFDSAGFCYKADSVIGAINMGIIEYERVARVEYTKTFGIIPNGIKVVLIDGTELRFASLKRKKIKNFLESKVNKARGG